MRKVLEYGSTVNVGGVEVSASNTGRLFYTVQGRTEEVKKIGDRLPFKTEAGMVFMTFLDRSAAKRQVYILIRTSRQKSGDVGRRRRKQGSSQLRAAAEQRAQE